MNEVLKELLEQRLILIKRINFNSSDGNDIQNIYVNDALKTTDDLIESLAGEVVK